MDVHGLSRFFFGFTRCTHNWSFHSIQSVEDIYHISRQNYEIRYDKNDFSDLADVPNVHGGLDGTLIPIRCPSIDQHLYFSHKVPCNQREYVVKVCGRGGGGGGAFLYIVAK